MIGAEALEPDDRVQQEDIDRSQDDADSDDGNFGPLGSINFSEEVLRNGVVGIVRHFTNKELTTAIVTSQCSSALEDSFRPILINTQYFQCKSAIEDLFRLISTQNFPK